MGRIGEKKIANYLREKGFTNIRRSAGSRGPADIYARGPAGDKFYIQAKYRGGHLGRDEIRKLRALAKKRGGVAAAIHRDKRGRHRWRFLGNWSSR